MSSSDVLERQQGAQAPGFSADAFLTENRIADFGRIVWLNDLSSATTPIDFSLDYNPFRGLMSPVQP